MDGDRVSPRQAVIVAPVSATVLAGTPLATWLPSELIGELVRAALQDVIGALVRVDGVTLTILGPTSSAEIEILNKLPAGIEMLDLGPDWHSPDVAANRAAVAIGTLLDRRFDRVAALTGDVIRLSPRIVATALSSLGDASVAIGLTQIGTRYLVGVRDRGGLQGVRLSDGDSIFEGTAALVGKDAERLVVRRMEPLPRLAELADRAELLEAVLREPSRCPRLANLVQIVTGRTE